MKSSNYEKILGVLVELKEAHPKCSMGKHLATAMDANIWNFSDAEILSSLQKYKERLSLDKDHSEEELEQIIKQGMNLHTILDDEDEE